MRFARTHMHTKACIVGKIVQSRVKGVGYIVRMQNVRLPNRYETKKHVGCRKVERPQLGWEDCVKGNLR